jgi:hypothetical protein
MTLTHQTVMASAPATNSPQQASSALSGLMETGYVAHVRFRVRCEALGHGEEVFLVAAEDTVSSNHPARKVCF